MAVLSTAMAVLSVFAHDRPFFSWDVTIAGWVMDTPGPGVSTFMEAVSWPGCKLAILITTLVATVIATRILGWRPGLLVFSVLIITALNEEFKEIIDRPRPGEFEATGNKSFPSGHVLYAVLVAGAVWFSVASKIPRLNYRITVVGILIGCALLTGLSRIYLEQHWPSDVLGAYLLGGIAVCGMAWAIPALERLPFGAKPPAKGEGS
jgi:undecaprenyl-diphosphatase